MDFADQRVADKFDRHASIAEEFLLKREDTERQGKATPDEICPPRAPRPKLRANVIDVFGAERLEFSGESQMKSRKIRQDGQ